MERSNDSTHSTQQEPKSSLAENIWTIISIIIAVIVVASFKEDTTELNKELIVIGTGVLLAIIGWVIKALSNFTDS
ncbi:hypothetical protein BKI52_25685 [marine bacterium AO1-C]|nr:hypothetical protein BKI52_25685 [marine bacterium AO1-C]